MFKNAMRVTSVLTPLLFVLFAGGLLAQGTAENIEGIACEITAGQASYKAAQPMTIVFKLKNETADTMYVLKWKTPLEGFNSDMFVVMRGEDKLTYIGRVVKRGAPKPGDYVKISPHGMVETSVDLSEAYAVFEKGDYSVTYSSYIYDMGKAKPVELAAKEQFAPKVIQSAAATFNVAEARPYKAIPTPSATAEGGTSFQGCSQTQQAVIDSALLEARNLVTGAMITLAIVPEASRDTCHRYTTWFGTYAEARWEKVKSNYDVIYDALTNKNMAFCCTCQSDYYAYVYPTQPYKIYLCNAFWNAPLTGTDSKAGTIIHETSHFNVVAGTGDYAYGHANCKNLANTNPANAIRNADSHEYFAENTPNINCYQIKTGPERIMLWILIALAILGFEILRRHYRRRRLQS